MKAFKEFILNIEKYVSAALLLAMLAILTLQVVSRYVFNATPSWSEETARYMFVWFAYLSCSYTYQTNGHIRIDVLLRLFPKLARKYIKKIGVALVIIFCAYVSYFSAIYVIKFHQVGQISLALQIPLSIVYASIPICFFFMTIRNIISFVTEKMVDEDDSIPSDAAEYLEGIEVAPAEANGNMTEKGER